MKRAALLSALVACGDRSLTRGLDEPIAVQNAQFIEGHLPGAPPEAPAITPHPTAVTTEIGYLRPRLANVPFFGWATADSVAVAAQIEGQGSGYWVVPTGPIDPTVQGDPVRTWRFITDFHDVAPGLHRLLVAATNDAGQTGSQVATTICINPLVPDNGNACDAKKVPPEIVVSLTWDRPVDLDLVVVAPNGEIIGAKNPSKGLAAGQTIDRGAIDKTPAGVGFLDFDSNADCHIDGRQIEDVVFQERPPPGSYLVYVSLHDACGVPNVRYLLSRRLRAAVDPTTFSVVEVDRAASTLTAIEASGSTSLGTFVSEFVVP